jgi:hypothetical protein
VALILANPATGPSATARIGALAAWAGLAAAAWWLVPAVANWADAVIVGLAGLLVAGLLLPAWRERVVAAMLATATGGVPLVES